MGAKDSEIREARKWRDGPATMELSNKDSALYLAVLYSMPVVEPVYPLYGPSPAKLALDLAGRIEELRCRQYIAAFEYTAKGYRLREERIAAWYALCDQLHAQNGYKLKPGFCPALVAANVARKAEQTVLDLLGALVGCSGDDFNRSLEMRAKALELVLDPPTK